jgi:para-nitrobenzyl esterase
MAHAFLRALDLTPATAERACEAPIGVLLDAQQRAAASVPARFGLLPWQPAVDGDLLPVPPLDAIAAGSARGVPLLLGTNRDEYNLFLLGNRAARGMDEARLGQLIARVVGARGADEASALYRELHPRSRPAVRWSALQTHRVFRAPAERLAELSARHTPETYSYLFTWSSAFAPGSVGSCHALEVPLVFGSWRRPALRLLYASGGGLSRAMQASWIAFARTGRPADARWLPHPGGSQPFVFGPRDEGAIERFERARGFWSGQGHGPGDVP